METALPIPSRTSEAGSRGAGLFAAAALGLAVLAAGIAGWFPVGFSIATVFLFAGPHNWIEFRFFLSRIPARWGPLRLFFLLGIGGALGLTTAFILLSVLGRSWEDGTWTAASAAWSTVF